MLGYRVKRKKTTMTPTGVKRDTQSEPLRLFHGRKGTYECGYEGPIPIVYCDYNTRQGVRTDKLVLCQPVRFNREMLLFNKPCLCGSLLHRSTKSLQCFLNERYLD